MEIFNNFINFSVEQLINMHTEGGEVGVIL